MFGAGQAKFTCTAAFLMSVQPILMTQSKNDAGGFDYSVPLSTMLSELLKLAISAMLLVRSRLVNPPGPLLSDDAVNEFFSFMLPGLIYFVNNNTLFFILQAVDPTTFQLLSQMKTIFTGLLFRVFLGSRLSGAQYLALVTLACGTATSQIPTGAATGHHGRSKSPNATVARCCHHPERHSTAGSGWDASLPLSLTLSHPPIIALVMSSPFASRRPRLLRWVPPLPHVVDALGSRGHLFGEAAERPPLGVHSLAEYPALHVGHPVQCSGRVHEGQ